MIASRSASVASICGSDASTLVEPSPESFASMVTSYPSASSFRSNSVLESASTCFRDATTVATDVPVPPFSTSDKDTDSLE